MLKIADSMFHCCECLCKTNPLLRWNAPRLCECNLKQTTRKQPALGLLKKGWS